MFELEESYTRCVFCKDPNCSNPKSGFFIIDPDTLESNSTKILIPNAPRNGKYTYLTQIETQPPVPHFIELNNNKFLKFNGKLNESAWLRCAKLLKEIDQNEASNYAMEVAHNFYKRKPSREEKISCVYKLYKIMYPNLEITTELLRL